MSQSKLAKLRNSDVFKACMRVLEDFRVPKEDYDVLDKRPHPHLTVRYCGVERVMTIPCTPKTKGRAPTVYAGKLRNMLKEMQMESLGGTYREDQQDGIWGAESPSNLVSIRGTEIRKVEYRGQQVVTFAMIDKVHQRQADTARKRFNDNKIRFVEGEDYFRVSASEIRTHKILELSPKAHEAIVLVTKRGYLKIAKTLGDDKAWEVFDEMLERYFASEATQPRPHYHIPQTYAEALLLAAKQAEQIEKKDAMITVMTPKAEFHDDVAVAINAHTFRDAAQIIGTGQNRLTAWLRDENFLMKNNRPYQRHEDSGLFTVIERTRKDRDTGERYIYPKTLITGKGIIYFQSKWKSRDKSQGTLL